ncbi:MAG: hypothetical protein AAF702_32950 [Chloroflexota bacterium]
MAVADILLGSASVWRAPVGEAEPDETSIAFGAAWGGNWVDMGYTTAPISLSRNVEEFELEVEQITNPVKRIITKEDVMVETTLAEQTAANMGLVLNGTSTTVAAGASQRGYEQVVSGGQSALSQYTMGFEGLYQDASNNKFPVRVVLYIVTVTLNGQLQFSKRAAAGVPAQFKSLADTAKAAGQQILKWQKVTAEATS